MDVPYILLEILSWTDTDKQVEELRKLRYTDEEIEKLLTTKLTSLK